MSLGGGNVGSVVRHEVLVRTRTPAPEQNTAQPVAVLRPRVLLSAVQEDSQPSGCSISCRNNDRVPSVSAYSSFPSTVTWIGERLFCVSPAVVAYCRCCIRCRVCSGAAESRRSAVDRGFANVKKCDSNGTSPT